MPSQQQLQQEQQQKRQRTRGISDADIPKPRSSAPAGAENVDAAAGSGPSSTSTSTSTEELHVYDFDGTLVNTPVPEVGMAQFEEATGVPWPHKGWWGRTESLEEPLTWEPGPAYEAFHRLLSVPRCRRVMLTGRRQKLAPQVTSIMQNYNFNVDEAIFNHTPHDTFTYKCQEIRRLVGAAGPTLRRVRIWEARIMRVHLHVRVFTHFREM